LATAFANAGVVAPDSEIGKLAAYKAASDALTATGAEHAAAPTADPTFTTNTTTDALGKTYADCRPKSPPTSRRRRTP
jgi:hypothetical protein